MLVEKWPVPIVLSYNAVLVLKLPLAYFSSSESTGAGQIYPCVEQNRLAGE